MRTTKNPAGTDITTYCYPTRGCDSPWGRLYSWTTAMYTDTTATDCGQKKRGICPLGWHIPSDYTSCANDDFPLLSTYLGGDSLSGGAMKASGTTYWSSVGGSCASMGTCFFGVGAGYWISGMFWLSRGYGPLWSSFQVSSNNARFRLLLPTDATFSRYDDVKTMGFSVRCAKDDPTVSDFYYPSGTYTSAVLPAGGAANWGTASWHSTLSGQPEITLKARSCADINCTGATDWGSCDTTTTIANGASLTSGVPNCMNNLQRFIQYQVGLSSNSPYTVTPTFDDITFAYDIVPDASFIGGFQFIGSVKIW